MGIIQKAYDDALQPSSTSSDPPPHLGLVSVTKKQTPNALKGVFQVVRAHKEAMATGGAQDVGGRCSISKKIMQPAVGFL